MDKNKGKQIKEGISIFFSFFDGAFNVVFSVLLIVAIIYFTKHYYEVGRVFSNDSVGIDKEFTLSLEEETSMGDVSKILADNGIIQSSFFLVLENMIVGEPKYKVKVGEYDLNANMTTNEIMQILYTDKSALAEEITITIVEGMTIRDIGSYLEELSIVTSEEFSNACEMGNFDFAFIDELPIRENRLEGYLFPDTYRIYVDSTAEQIINKMLVRFEEIYYTNFDDLAKEKGLTVDEVITMASIIESEVMVPEERNLVASVINNRLSIDMPLQMCSTIQYTLEKRRDVITLEDLEIDTPYNTYKYIGLPVGPISNPGEASMRAVLEPADTDYLYFVLKDSETGEHFFTSNYDEFLSAKEEYGQVY
ncbi:MAG: endolytic transglycosylase MltG [Lachnospirales bacterium]